VRQCRSCSQNRRTCSVAARVEEVPRRISHALAHPARQVRASDESQVLFKQLHLEGAFGRSGIERHAPVPDFPSSHLEGSENRSLYEYEVIKCGGEKCD
jgi:hypothetical protein